MSDEQKPFHNPFASLAGLKASLPQTAPTAAAPTPPATPPGVRVIPRAVVRLERSGRGGKEVTVIEHLDLSPLDREKWLKALKAALGCGGVLEDASIVLQGDHRQRLPAILTQRGVKKVVLGS